MKLSDVISGIAIKAGTADLSMEIAGVSSDSRRVQTGELFVAVRGYESDGHQYIEAAVKKGAACVLCEEAPGMDIPYILTDNTRRGLAASAANWYGNPSSGMTMIGVTGTNGKTTTTHMLKDIIEKCAGGKVGLIGTNYIVIGDAIYEEAHHTTPESNELQLLFRKMADAGCTHVVMEVSSHALYLDRVHGVRFDVGVFTNLTQDHLDFHKTMEEYAAAKAKLFLLADKAVINYNDEYAEVMMNAAGRCAVTTYAIENDAADVVAKRTRIFADRVEFSALTMEKLQRFEIGIPARFTVYNALAAISTGLALGCELEAIADVLAAFRGVKGRLEVVPTGRDFTVIIDYAHTPDALENIIKPFKELGTGRVVTLFGCGGDRDRSKRPLMGEIAARLSDFVIVSSDNPRTEVPGKIIEDILEGMKGTSTPYNVIENRREAIGWAIRNAQPKDIILLAGKGHETYQILGKEKVHFDEREIVREFLE